MGKNKKSGVRLTPFIIILIIIGLIIAGIIVFFYFKTIKVLKDTNVEITSFEANESTISFNALVDGDIDYYDIYAYNEDSDNKIYIVEGATPSQEAKAYNYTFDSYGSFELYVSLAKGLFGVMDITTDKSYEEFNILYNPNEAVEGVVYDDFQVHFPPFVCSRGSGKKPSRSNRSASCRITAPSRRRMIRFNSGFRSS